MLALLLLTLAQPPGLDVYGEWVIPPDEEGGPSRGTVEIVRDEDPSNDYPDGTPVGRITTVGEVLRGDPGAADALGMTILWGFEADEDDDRWEDGKILDPEADRTYRAKIQREGDTLSVKGCIAFFCREQVWIAVPADAR